MSMPTPSPGTPDRHRLHPRCKQTCRFMLTYLWAIVEPLLPILSSGEPICWTGCMIYLLWPVGLTRSPKSVGRFPCFLDHTVDMQRWPSIDVHSTISLSSRPGWVSSWIWSAPSPNYSIYLWSWHCCWVCWRESPWWSWASTYDTSVHNPVPWR